MSLSISRDSYSLKFVVLLIEWLQNCETENFKIIACQSLNIIPVPPLLIVDFKAFIFSQWSINIHNNYFNRNFIFHSLFGIFLFHINWGEKLYKVSKTTRKTDLRRVDRISPTAAREINRIEAYRNGAVLISQWWEVEQLCCLHQRKKHGILHKVKMFYSLGGLPS